MDVSLNVTKVVLKGRVTMLKDWQFKKMMCQKVEISTFFGHLSNMAACPSVTGITPTSLRTLHYVFMGF